MKGHPERHLYLDIKNVDLAQLAAEVKNAGVERQVVLGRAKDCDDSAMEGTMCLPPTLFLWMSGTEESKRKQIEELRSPTLRGLRRSRCMFVCQGMQRIFNQANRSRRRARFSAS
jgi:hypothetical protein